MSEITTNRAGHGSLGLSVSVETVNNSLDRLQKILGNVPGAMYRASAAAIKRALQSGKTAVKKTIAQEYYISSGSFLANTRERYTVGSDGFDLHYSGWVIPLIKFHYSGGKGGRVHAAVKRGGGGEITEAFLQSVGGHVGLFERESPARLPIHELFGPSTPQMMYTNPAVVEEVDRKVSETYEKRIEHEIGRILSGG